METFGKLARRGRAACCVVGLVSLAGVLAPGAARGDSDLQLKLYGDADYALSRERSAMPTNGFSIPTTDIFGMAFHERWSFLAEVVLEYDENTLATDIERIEVQYGLADWLNVRAGRFHQAIGWYNDAYHHGMYFQLPVHRPAAVNFEDKSGLLPAHMVGLHFDGRLPVGAAGAIRYDAEVGNNRGRTPHELAANVDPSKSKAVNFRLRFEPAVAPDLVVGANLILDDLPGSSTLTDFSGPPIPGMRERILGAHLAYLHHPFHVIVEGYRVQHDEKGVADHVSLAGFAELGYAIGAFEPYFRFDRAVLAAADPFLQHAGIGTTNFSESSLGVKWTASDHIAVKLEGDYHRPDRGDDGIGVAAQLAYGF